MLPAIVFTLDAIIIPHIAICISEPLCEMSRQSAVREIEYDTVIQGIGDDFLL